MNNSHEVISAFLDDEPFDAAQLADALSEPEGTAAMIDLIALRHVLQPPANATIGGRPRRSRLRVVLAAAAVIVATAGGFWLGERSGLAAQSTAPKATRVIEAPAAWQQLP